MYENNEAKAVMVDMVSFEKIEMILDNLMNQEAEPEDRILAASDMLKKLLNEAMKAASSKNWRIELDEL